MREAALKGSAEVSYTILSMSVSLVAVFLPILLMGGVVGRLFNEFGMVVTLAIMASALVSLTVTPMLASRLSGQTSRPPLVIRWFDAGFSRTLAGYDRSVRWCLNHRAIVMAAFMASVAASGWLYHTLPSSFFPQEDIGQLSVPTRAREDISFAAMKDLQGQVAAIIAKNPAVIHVTSIAGGNSRNPMNNGSMFVQLKPKDQRPPLNQTLAELRRETAGVAGSRTYITPQQSLRFGGRSSASQYQLVVQGLNADATSEWSGKLMAAMQQDRSFQAVTSDAQNGAIAASVVIDPEKAAQFGITNDQLRKTLEMSFGGYTAAQIQSTGDSYNVDVEFDNSRTWSDDILSDINVLSAKTGALVPLSNFATVQRVPAPVTINQTGQLVSTTISFNLPDGVALSDAMARIDAIKASLGMPSDVFTTYGGAAAIFQQSQGNTGLLILAAVLTIYVVLGVLYESFVHPLTILSGLPAAAFGALLALKLAGLDFSLIALIGLLMLIGIVKKNAIMMIDVAVELMREKGETPIKAIHEACVRRFRPILMTTFCAMLGALPIALGSGASSELRQPLGIAVVGGLVVSQLLTLFITPVIFIELNSFGGFLTRLFNRSSRPQAINEASAMAQEAAPVAETRRKAHG